MANILRILKKISKNLIFWWGWVVRVNKSMRNLRRINLNLNLTIFHITMTLSATTSSGRQARALPNWPAAQLGRPVQLGLCQSLLLRPAAATGGHFQAKVQQQQLVVQLELLQLLFVPLLRPGAAGLVGLCRHLTLLAPHHFQPRAGFRQKT